MSARERILAIRLLEKAARHPAYAKALGIGGPGPKGAAHERGGD